MTRWAYLGRLSVGGLGALWLACRLARRSPASQPGACPFGGGAIDRMSWAVVDSAHDTSELEFHMSPCAQFVAPPGEPAEPAESCAAVRDLDRIGAHALRPTDSLGRGRGCGPRRTANLVSGRPETCRARSFPPGLRRRRRGRPSVGSKPGPSRRRTSCPRAVAEPSGKVEHRDRCCRAAATAS